MIQLKNNKPGIGNFSKPNSGLGGSMNSMRLPSTSLDAQKDAQAPNDKKYVCTWCGSEYTKLNNNFPPSKSPIYTSNDFHITVCKSCVIKYYNRLVDFFSGNEEMAIERVCQIFDWYYSEDAAEMSKKLYNDSSRIMSYVSKMNIRKIQDLGTTYLDTVRGRSSGIISSGEDVKRVSADTETDTSGLEDAISRWGLGFS